MSEVKDRLRYPMLGVDYSGTRTKYYWRGIRLPRWLFVTLYGEPRITFRDDEQAAK